MRNLFVNRLKYEISCEDKSIYGANISFKKGLNIIYGPNSVGKSSIILGVIYGLGMEKSLGIFQTKQNPFKPEFYDKIDDKKIIDSQVFLEISNGKKTVTINRKIIGKTETCILKECDIDSFSGSTGHELIADGPGVMTDNGLQKYVFELLDWDIVEVPKYEGEPSKLYLENLTPLFFVEQNAGWSQIQARQVTRYGIKDIKKIVFEYLMGLDKFDIHLTELRQRELREKINMIELDLQNKETNLMVLGNATKDDENNLFIKHNIFGNLRIVDLLLRLEEDISQKIKMIDSFNNTKEKAEIFESKGRDKLREITHRRRVASEKVNSLIREISSYNNYIKNIEINRLKNLQLKKINESPSNINVDSCPICESKLSGTEEGYCHLCKQYISKISTPDENIAFLEDERSSFMIILKQKEMDLEKAKQQLKELQESEREHTEKLNFQLKTYYGADLQKIREIQSEADAIQNEIQKYKTIENQWNGLKSIRSQIHQYVEEETELKKQIMKDKQSLDDSTILNKILSNFRKNVIKLRLFKNKPELASELKLDDTDNYSPYLGSYDLYNISSSSDNIRIILSYYLSLLQTSVDIDNKKIKFPNLLIFDEPKQQNLDEQDFENLIEIIEQIPKERIQVILTTFNNKNKDKIKDHIRHEMFSSNDYLLKRQ